MTLTCASIALLSHALITLVSDDDHQPGNLIEDDKVVSQKAHFSEWIMTRHSVLRGPRVQAKAF